MKIEIWVRSREERGPGCRGSWRDGGRLRADCVAAFGRYWALGRLSSSQPCPSCPQDCARGTANCVLFSCPLYSFDRAAVLHVWGRLWNSTFLEVRRGWAPAGVLFPAAPPGLSSLLPRPFPEAPHSS